MYAIQNQPWTRIKGPRSRRRRNYRYKTRSIPSKFTSDSLIKLKTQFDIPGRVNIDDPDAGTITIPMVYRPLRLTATEQTIDGVTALFGKTVEWNDGILTGNLSHYFQLPAESKNTNNSAKAATSNLMIYGNQLWGGSVIGYDWEVDTTRQFSGSQIDTADPSNLTLRMPMCTVNGTKALHLHSYALHLQETPWVNPSTFVGQPSSTPNRLFRSFPLFTEDKLTGIQDSSIPADLGSISTSTLELKTLMQREAKIKVRQLVIRLPPEPYTDAASQTIGTHTLELNAKLAGAFPGGFTWQQVAWNAIKDDFMLVGDHTYGPPTGYNADLRARINPKYTILQDTTFTIGLPSTPGSNPTPRYHHFSHAFASKYPTNHTVAPTKFACKATTSDIADDDLVTAYTQVEVQGNPTSDILFTAPISLEAKVATAATRGTKRDSTGNPITDTDDKGVWNTPSSTIPQTTNGEMDIESTATGQPSLKAIAEVQMDVLCPTTNRIVVVRIPRLAGQSELMDLQRGDKAYPIGRITSTDSQPAQRLLLSALTQLCTTIKGNTTFKFINPTVIGRGEARPPMLKVEDVFGSAGAGAMTGN